MLLLARLRTQPGNPFEENTALPLTSIVASVLLLQHRPGLYAIQVL